MSGIGGSSSDYNGPETNDVYDDADTFESFDDLDDDDTYEEYEQQGTQSHDGESFEDQEEAEEEEAAQKKVVKAAKDKKEAAKKARGQKNDDLEALETMDDLDDEEEETEEAEDKEEESDEEESEESKEDSKEEKEETPAEKKAKGKPTYVTVDGETYALDSNAEVSVQVDGKAMKVPLQELKNNYAGKQAWDKKFNEINLKEQTIKREAAQVQEKFSKFEGVKQKIEQIIKDPAQNPKDALKIFLDSVGMDSYDLMERQFKADLTELANVLNMEPAERKSYFLEKKNSHLLEQSRKRDEQLQNAARVTSYTQKVDALRKSYGVSEAQYVDALEELKSYGTEEKDLREQDIVEWAATKPHRETVKSLLTPYRDQFDEDTYGELSWKLANILRAGSESPDDIKKHLKSVYGVPTEVKQLSKKLNPLGRKGKVPPKVSPKKKQSYESFDDIDDD